MTPCEGCSNPKGCLSRAMQYKENEEMDEINEKAIVKIDADGGVVKCAKGLGSGECGYKAGAKVCGACGAMAVMQKNDSEGEDLEEKGGMKKPMAEEMMNEEENPEEEMMDEESDKTWMMKPTKRSRGRAMSSMGMKSADFDDDAYICQLERKAYPGSSDICENCPGGCRNESGMPGLVDVEGVALDILGGKVLDSGYSFTTDLFVVQVEAKDGKTWEMISDGQSGEMLQLQRISAAEAGIESKSLEDDEFEEGAYDVITATDAVDIALKSLETELGLTGDVVRIDSDILDDDDVYVVEVNGSDGMSYDVFVGLDGNYAGYQPYTQDEVEEIEAEAAEIALKRAYSEESRMTLAESGMAMPDGSYPIKDVADLRNAIRAYGRAKDKPATKKHIMKRAEALGASDLIPANWMDEGKSLDDEVEVKRDYSEDQRMAMAKAGEAMEDGSFPIKDKNDLMNAIQSLGRAKDTEAAKAHIIKRAMDLGAEDMIPVNWVPKKVQTQFAAEKSDDIQFLKSLMEFEILAQEVDIDKTL